MVFYITQKLVIPHYQQQGYDLGYNQASVEIISVINQQGEIPIIFNNTIIWVNLNQICRGQNG